MNYWEPTDDELHFAINEAGGSLGETKISLGDLRAFYGLLRAREHYLSRAKAVPQPQPVQEPYGQVTTHAATGQQFFYRWPHLPYLDNARECVVVYSTPQAQPEPVRSERHSYVPVDSNMRDGNGNHPNDKEPRTAACIQALNARGDSEGQGLDGFWKWGFAAGFNAALAAAPQPALGLTNRRKEDAAPPKTNSLDRAIDLHEKSCMPWEQAEKLALEEVGIGDTEIDELIGNASSHAIVGLLGDEEVREFVRSILVHQYALKPSACAVSPREALAQPQPVQEPVAWWYDTGNKVHLETSKLDHYHVHSGEYVKGKPLVFANTTPQAQPLTQPEQDRCKELADLGWQAIECPACGSSARGYPRPAQPAQDLTQANQPHPTNNYLFKLMCSKAGIVLGADRVDEACRKIEALAQPAQPMRDEISHCANCGKPGDQAADCLSDYPEDGEWFCSAECKDQHDDLGCPHEHHGGYRHPPEARRLIDCENTLRSLACWLGVGGHNAENVDANVFEAKIRHGVEHMHSSPKSAQGGKK